MDDNSNPHLTARGDVYNSKKADERISEACGKPIEQIRTEHNSVFERFKLNLIETISKLREDNTKLRNENAKLRQQIKDQSNNLSGMQAKGKSNRRNVRPKRT